MKIYNNYKCSQLPSFVNFSKTLKCNSMPQSTLSSKCCMLTVLLLDHIRQSLSVNKPATRSSTLNIPSHYERNQEWKTMDQLFNFLQQTPLHKMPFWSEQLPVKMPVLYTSELSNQFCALYKLATAVQSFVCWLPAHYSSPQFITVDHKNVRKGSHLWNAPLTSFDKAH